MTEITNQAKVTSKYTLPDFTAKYNDIKSNESSVAYMTDLFLKQKEMDKLQACPNQKIKQTLLLANNSEYTIFDIIVYDTITTGATVDDGTVEINNIAYPYFDVRDGINIPQELPAGESLVLTYTLTIDNNASVKNVTLISNVTYSVNEVDGLNENSNKVTVEIVNNNLTIDNQCNKSVVVKGEKITFQHTISNTGDFENTNLFFKNSLSNGALFVDGTVTVDGTLKSSLNPIDGFDLPDLLPNKDIVITFEAEVQ